MPGFPPMPPPAVCPVPVVFPPFTAIHAVAQAFNGYTGFSVGGQDVYFANEGAFTGEISSQMLMNAGCTYVLTGHSERRHVLGESNELVGKKTVFGNPNPERYINQKALA